MKKRSIMLVSAIVLAVLLVVGGTMAWFTDKKEVTNRFEAGTVTIGINENDFTTVKDWVPGDKETKNVDIDVTSKSDTYVRVKLTPEWKKIEGEAKIPLALKYVKIYFLNPCDWVKANGEPVVTFDADGNQVGDGIVDGWIYYKGSANGIVKNPDKLDLIEHVEFVGINEDQNLYQEAIFTLGIETQAVQAANNAYKTQWGLSKLPWD